MAQAEHRDGQRVLAFLKPYVKWVVADSFVIALSQVCAALIPTLALSWLVDTIIPEEKTTWLWGLMWLIIAAAIFDLIFMVIDEYFCHQVAKSVTNWQKLRLFKHLQLLPFSFFTKSQSGELLARTSDDPDTLHNFLAWEGSTFMATVQGVIIYSAVLLWLHPLLMVASVVLGILFYYISNYVGARSREASAAARTEASRYLERLRESVTGIQLSRTLGVAEYEIESVRTIRQSFVTESIRELKSRMQSIFVVGSYNGVALAFVYAISTWLIWRDGITTGQMLTAGSLVTITANEMQRMLRTWLSVRRTGPALDRSDILMKEEVSPLETFVGQRVDHYRGNLTFEHVAFAYPEKEERVLHDISFHVKAGETVALVGPSGSGKSTIIDLLLRLYDLSGGTIRFDGTPIETLDTNWLRSQISVVAQDVQIRSGSLADNLRIGKRDATDDELWNVLEQAGLADFVRTLPNGLATAVGERGNLFSGGQKQRLSLARALLRQTPILVLDEASSALDPITELQINEAVLKQKSKQTIFLISHRLSTVLAADHIVVMERGRVVEHGTHDTLLANDDVYARLFKREAETGEAFMQ